MPTPNPGHGAVRRAQWPSRLPASAGLLSFLFYADAGRFKCTTLSGPPFAWGLGVGILTRSPGYRGRPGEGCPWTRVLGKFCVYSFCC